MVQGGGSISRARYHAVQLLRLVNHRLSRLRRLNHRLSRFGHRLRRLHQCSCRLNHRLSRLNHRLSRLIRRLRRLQLQRARLSHVRSAGGAAEPPSTAQAEIDQNGVLGGRGRQLLAVFKGAALMLEPEIPASIKLIYPKSSARDNVTKLALG